MLTSLLTTVESFSLGGFAHRDISVLYMERMELFFQEL